MKDLSYFNFDEFELAALSELAYASRIGQPYYPFDRLCEKIGIPNPQFLDGLLMILINKNLIEEHGGDLTIQDGLIEFYESVRNPPKPNYPQMAWDWYASKPWAIVTSGLIFGLPLAVQWVEGLRTILGWFFPGFDDAGN